MAQTLTTTMHFATDPAHAYAMVTNSDYATARAEHTEGTDVTVTVSGDPAVVVSRRTLPIPEELPSFAKSLVGDGIVVEETHTWGEAAADGRRVADVTLVFPSMPVKVVGTMTLAPAGDGTDVTLEVSITASMPMVGPVIEQGVKAQIRSATQQEEAFAATWLTR